MRHERGFHCPRQEVLFTFVCAQIVCVLSLSVQQSHWATESNRCTDLMALAISDFAYTVLLEGWMPALSSAPCTVYSMGGSLGSVYKFHMGGTWEVGMECKHRRGSNIVF